MLKVLLPEDRRDRTHLGEMLQLRYDNFAVRKGWRDGLDSRVQHETDRFDHKYAFYLVHINDNTKKVDCSARLTQTIYPNVTMDLFIDNIDFMLPERNFDTLEISRFCSDARSAPKNVMNIMVAGLLEIGNRYNIKHYVSFADTYIKVRSEKCGWETKEIGEVVPLEKGDAVAMKHDVNEEQYKSVMAMLKMNEPILEEEELIRCPLRRRSYQVI